MTTREVVATARRACVRAELRLQAARRSGDGLRLQAERLHWEQANRDLQRALLAVCQ